MFWLLSAGLIVAGVVLGRHGVRRFRRQRSVQQAAGPRGSVPGWRRADRWLLGLAATLLLLPDAFAGLLTDYPGWSVFLAFTAWRSIALFWIGVLALVAVATSRRSRQLARETVTTVGVKLPSASGWRLRRHYGLDDFPQTWDALLDFDATLSRRLVSYQHDLEALANRPTMADYTNPATRAAVAAMTSCDRLRTHTAPVTRDVITTEYGRAVAEFASTLRAAEEAADQAARSGLGVDERERLAEAAQIIAFISSNATTPGDRERAYRRVRELLATTGGPADRTKTQHPWLNVAERADLNAHTR